MRKILPRLVMLAALCVSAPVSAPAHADVKLIGYLPPKKADGPSFYQLRLTATISESDVLQLDRLLNSSRDTGRVPAAVIMRLDTPGGDIRAAMQVGRILMKHRALATVDEGAVCASACVLVLAGARSRGVYGEVRIHRPYLPLDTQGDAGQQRKKYDALRTEVSAFLDDANIPAVLYDDMLRIPPSQSKLLTEADLDRYGLSADDPYEAEAAEVREAIRLGLTREEHIRREAEVERVCRAIPRARGMSELDWLALYYPCKDRIMHRASDN